ncbi:MAG: hypothetical protein ACFFB7_03920 [Candidatus Sifarchaeia archaeon]
MTRNRLVIDPYCLYCGEYKGVGYCLDPTCRGSQVPKDGGDSTLVMSITSVPRAQSDFCRVCRGQASFECRKCGTGFCKEHAAKARETVMSGIEHHLGLCCICQELVCEDCWILDGEGRITCLDHLEEE